MNIMATILDANSISITDFSDICRICLKRNNDMIDIFASGISNQMTGVTNIEVSYEDKLPMNLCQNCGIQLEEFYKFQCLAKDSDNFLRELLKKEEIPAPSRVPLRTVQKRKKKRIHQKFVKLKSSQDVEENSGADKLYLILVSDTSENTGSQNEIFIKDLGEESETNELTDLCKSLIRNKFNENSHLNDHGNSFCKTQINQSKKNNDNVYKVNLFIYSCGECNETFESKDMLTEHLKNYHKTQILNMTFSYTCPVCLLSDCDKNVFMDHLIEHKKIEGSKFIKVDTRGNWISLTKLEETIFEMPILDEGSIIRNKIFKINTGSFACALCKKILSLDAVHEHLEICFPDYKKDDSLLVHAKYSCPACSESWVDNIEAMNAHFASHKMDNIFFVKVNDSGKSVELGEEDFGYTEFEKALDLLSGNNINSDIKSKIIKMWDYNSCIACNFRAESVIFLSEHYMESHEQVMPLIEMICPVCEKHFESVGFEENAKFIDHLKNHKSEGYIFLKINKNGFVNGALDNCALFSDLNDLYNGKVRCSELEFINGVYVPEVFFGTGELSVSEFWELSRENDYDDNLKTDKQNMNKRNWEYICEKCGRKCFGRGNYKRHFVTHTQKSEITSSAPKHPSCSVCRKTFSNRAALNEHEKHHGNTVSDAESVKKICEICGRSFANNASLAKHRILHVNHRESSLLKCNICGRGFRKDTALKRHVSYHLNPNYFECEICKLPLPSSGSLERHKMWHQGGSNTHDCKVCKISFLTKDRLIAHQTHTGHLQDRKRFECNVCHERFFIGREFNQHIKLHPKYKMSECSLCGKRLSTVQSLMLHLSRHFESNSILCPHCGKLFFEERNYHRHLLTHKGVKPFSCDFEGCKKSFYTYFELNRHKKYHNNTRNFSCPYCPKSFHEASHLKVHIRTHTGERPYICPHCSRGFVTRTRCKQHINLIHQGVGCDLIRSSISKKVAVFEALENTAE